MSKKPNSRQTQAGVPRSYASTNLPTPDEVLKQLFAPFRIWEVLVLFATLVGIGTYGLITYSSISFNMMCLWTGTAVASAAIVMSAVHSPPSGSQSVPSIADVHRSTEYSRLASILTLTTAGSGVSSVALLLVAGLFGDRLISSFVLLCVVGIGGVMFAFSYGVVRSLVSYVPQFSDSVWASLVENTSLFETVAIVGMISCPVALFAAGFLWNQPQIITVTVPMSTIDAAVLMTGFACAYIAAVNRV